ncbi:MAG TPA: NUDIX domain-containing protein [Patescibacteria group bacterium]|nr:NUDIX domain-containing protein [Patescibacteria group bacterium]
MADQPKEFASVILKSLDGRFILQLRDDKPEIVDPGKLSLFASRIQDGEEPLDAAVRTLREETTLVRPKENLTFYTHFIKDPARHTDAGGSHVFVATVPVDPTKITVRQGQGYRLKSPNEIAEAETAPITYDILIGYVAGNRA